MALEQPAPAPQPNADDDFAAAFASFAQPEPAAPAATDPPEPAPVATDPPEPAPVVDPPIVEPPAAAEPPAAEPPAEPPAAVAPEPTPAEPVAVVEPPKPAPTADDILNRLDQIVSKTPAPAAEPAPAPAAAEEAPPLYSDEEQQFLAGYEKDWSDVTKGEALRRRAENAALVQFIFSEVGKVLNPLRETTEVLAQRTHYTDIEQKIGQYDDSLRDQVEAWIATQPDYLQTAYNDVINKGTSGQVVDLVARFRKETGQAPQPAETKGVTELSGATKQAVAALAPVDTKRTVIEQKDDPNDFEGAFSRFAEALRPK
jgi:hypothetical protein